MSHAASHSGTEALKPKFYSMTRTKPATSETVCCFPDDHTLGERKIRVDVCSVVHSAFSRVVVTKPRCLMVYGRQPLLGQSWW